MKINELILGSSSKFRAQILRQAGIQNFRQVSSDADEDLIQEPSPKRLAQLRSDHKGMGVPVTKPSLIIAGDQVLEFKGKPYGKADSEDQAFERLRQFSGTEHQLHSAYTLLHREPGQNARVLKSEVVTANMAMRDLSDEQIRAYLKTNEWQGCAGCYQFENQGVHLFKGVVGDSFTIVGLPLPQLLCDLTVLGMDLLTKPEGPWEVS